MPYLAKQIEIINEALKTRLLTSPRFAHARLCGLATEVAEQVSEGVERRFPVTFDNAETDPVSLVIDDRYSLTVYHKQGLSNFGVSSRHSGYGGINNTESEVQEMSMVVYAKRKRIKLLADDIASLINLAMPTQVLKSTLLGTKLDAMRVFVVSKDMDSAAVFGGEYVNVDRFIGADDIMFKINYRIETQYRKDCFDLCDCP